MRPTLVMSLLVPRLEADPRSLLECDRGLEKGEPVFGAPRERRARVEREAVGDPSFYEASAQVIPVLYLALIVGARLGQSAPASMAPSLRAWLGAYSALMALGEAGALWALYRDEGDPVALALVLTAYAVAILFGFAWVIRWEPPGPQDL